MARIDLRLNEVKHKDIIDALSNAKDVSKEVRRLLRIAINIKYNQNVFIETMQPQIPVKSKPKELSKDNIEDLQKNLMSIDFSFDDE